MKTEFEVRILDIDPGQIKRKLDEIDAIHHGDFHMQRCVYNIPGKEGHTWIRLRHDGIKSTLAYKERKDDGVKGVSEAEVRVDSFNKAKQILDNMNLKFVAWQENKREQYQLGEIEFSIDYWPLLPPHVEVEGPDEAAVKKGVELLGYTMDQTTTKTKLELYKDKGIDQHKYKKLTFDVQE